MHTLCNIKYIQACLTINYNLLIINNLTLVPQVPEELFTDIVESNNLVANALATLCANVDDNAASLPPTLVKKCQRFKKHVSTRFGWSLDLLEEGDDAPVVVEM